MKILKMIKVKSKKEIAILGEGGKILAKILEELAKKVNPGATGLELDKLARDMCLEYNVKPSFLGYGGRGHDAYPAAACISVNEAVVHGIPNDRPFEAGDIVGLDMGIIYNDLYLDSAHTVACGDISPEAQRLLEVTRESLRRGIEAAQLGNTTGDIGWNIQQYVEKEGYGVVQQLVGHGVGYGVHEDPQVPNYGRAGEGTKLTEGLVIAIEPMVTIGSPGVTTADDDWTIVTTAGGLAAHEEHTVAITKEGPLVLT